MNPLSAVVERDQLKLLVKKAEILSRAGEEGITIDDSYNDGKGYKAENGILTLSIIGNAGAYTSGKEMPIFALQAQVPGPIDEETEKPTVNTVVSDYAMFAQMNVQPMAIQYNIAAYNKQFNASNRRDFQQVVTTASNTADMDPALVNATATTVKWNDKLDILSLLEIEYKDVVRGTSGAWTSPEEWAKYDLKMNFQLVDYTIGSNTVSESSWAVIDPATGVLTPCVNRDPSKQSPDELGHMPLVYVTVTQGDNIVLNGFLKVKITPSEDDYVTDTVKFAAIDFNCNSFEEQQLPDYQPLDMIVKTTELSRETFLANYKPVTKQVTINGEPLEVFVQYNKAIVQGVDSWAPVAADREIGYIVERWKQLNDDIVYDFGWLMDDAYAKQLVYQQANHTATVYICFEGQSDVYADVYLPFQISVNNKPELTVGTKVLAKWFRENDNTALLNVPQPHNGNFVTTINANLDQLWTNDRPTFSPKPVDYLGYKYYFSALNNRTVDGITYSVANRTNPNLLAGIADPQSKANMGVNALLVGQGNSEYDNDALYANGVEIATLNQSTGVVTYSTTAAALEYLNKFDSMGGEDRPDAKLGGIIGMVPYSTCDLAYAVTNGDFNVAFLRPINVDQSVVYPFTDATANGSVNDVYNMLAFSDWRNISFKNNEWLYAYYNVKSIILHKNEMTTDIANPGSGNFFAASQSLKDCFDYPGGTVTYSRSDISSSNNAGVQAMVKRGFGQIIYNNNDVNVKSFKVRLPFTVEYELGSISVTIECTINTTLGN